MATYTCPKCKMAIEKEQAKCSFCNTKIEWKQDKKKGSQELLEEINSHLAVIEEKSKHLRSDVAILTGVVLVQLVVILFLTIYIFSNLIS